MDCPEKDYSGNCKNIKCNANAPPSDTDTDSDAAAQTYCQKPLNYGPCPKCQRKCGGTVSEADCQKQNYGCGKGCRCPTDQFMSAEGKCVKTCPAVYAIRKLTSIRFEMRVFIRN